MGRLHGLVNDRQQLGGEGIKVDVLAQADAERLDGLGRVVLAAVEVPVNSLLDAAAGRRNAAATAKVAPATTQLGGWRVTPPNRCPTTRTTPA
jgi:hypothetical protein